MVASVILAGLADKLISNGVEWIGETVGSESSKVVNKVFKKVKQKTGVDLLKAGNNGENLKPEDIMKLKEYDLEFRVKEFDAIMNDKEKARTAFHKLTESGTSFTKNTGSIIGLIIILAGIAMDTFLVYHFFTSDNLAEAFEQVNAIVTFIAGFYHAAMMVILTFYYGAAKTEADKHRHENIDNIRNSLKSIQEKELEFNHANTQKVLDNNRVLKESLRKKDMEIKVLNQDDEVKEELVKELASNPNDELTKIFEEEPKDIQEIADMISQETYNPKL